MKMVIKMLTFSFARRLRYLVGEARPPLNVPFELLNRAVRSSADYVQANLQKALLFQSREKLWDYAIRQVEPIGICVEFGVFNGDSINYFAKHLPRQTRIYGFDSFEGLKEDWIGSGLPTGSFGLRGNLPRVRSNVSLIKGWFNDTIPEFLRNHEGPFSFIHLDADTYESTDLVLKLVGDRIIKGTVIIFDEYHGYPNWENGEHLAWKQFASRSNVRYQYLAFSTEQAAVKVV